MENQMVMKKDCEVEVRTEEEGFIDVWYRAVLEENTTLSGRKKIRIRYKSLLSADGSSPLIETVQQKLIRPVPPEKEYIGIVLEEGAVVDADYKDGWWTGVIIKKKPEDDKFLVLFDSPPDIIQCKRNQLRAHVEWTGWKWRRPEKEELDKSLFCPGTVVEISSVKEETGLVWFPAMIVKENEEDDDDERKFIVKDCDQIMSSNGDEAILTATVGMCRLRPTPPPVFVQKYQLWECVEAFDGLLWRQGLVKGISHGTITGYVVSFKGTKKMEGVFERLDLRPLRVWENGVWHNGQSTNLVKETPKTPMRCSSGAKPTNSKSATKHMNSDDIGETTLTKN